MENGKNEVNSTTHQKRDKQTDAMPSNSGFPDVVELNVGGRYFATSVETLTRCKGSVLEEFFSGEPGALPRDKDGRKKQFRRRLLGMCLPGCLKCNIRYCFFACLDFESANLKDQWSEVAAMCRKRFFIDSDGMVFSHILNYLRSNQLPRTEVAEAVYNEAVVLGLEDLTTALEVVPPILVKICKESTRNIIPEYKKFLSSLTEWISDDCKENILGLTTICIAMQAVDNNATGSEDADQNHICFGVRELTKAKVNTDLYFGPWGSAVKASEEEMLGFIVSDLVEKGFNVSDFGPVCDQCQYISRAGENTKQCRRRLFQITVRWWHLPQKSTNLKRANFCNGLYK